MIQGVIFDMDGLMTNTEQLFIDLWCEVMVERGMPEHRDIVTHCIGLDHKLTEAYVHERLGAEFDYHGVIMDVAARSVCYCDRHGVPVKPGLYALLDFLDEKGLPYAVATSTKSENARRRLENIKILPRLGGLITGDMVTKGKPNPDIFLMAAEALALPPESCLVLEDSPHGILAAHRAGCVPVMVPDLKQPDEETLSRVYGVCKSLYDVIPLLETLI